MDCHITIEWRYWYIHLVDPPICKRWKVKRNDEEK